MTINIVTSSLSLLLVMMEVANGQSTPGSLSVVTPGVYDWS